MADVKIAGSATEKQTLVEEGTELKGSIKSSCPVVVRGKIEGDVATPSLTVSLSGAVHGHARVGSLTSQGELAGEFDADVVQLSGKVLDKTVIRAKSLEVKLTPTTGRMQVVFGECSLDVGDEPSKTDAKPEPKTDALAARPEEPLALGAPDAVGGGGRGGKNSTRPPRGSDSIPPPPKPEIAS